MYKRQSQGCAITGEIVLAATNARFKESVAIILAVIAGGKTANIWVDGCFNSRTNIIGAGILNN